MNLKIGCIAGKQILRGPYLARSTDLVQTADLVRGGRIEGGLGMHHGQPLHHQRVGVDDPGLRVSHIHHQEADPVLAHAQGVVGGPLLKRKRTHFNLPSAEPILA